MRKSVLLAALLGLLAAAPGRAEPPSAEEQARLEAEALKADQERGALYRQGRMREALSRAERVLALARQLYPREQFPDGHRNLASSLNNVGITLRALGRPEEALTHLQQAQATYRRLYPPQRFPDGHPDLAGSFNGVGNVLQDLGRPEAAREQLQQAVAMNRKLFPAGHAEPA